MLTKLSLYQKTIISIVTLNLIMMAIVALTVQSKSTATTISTAIEFATKVFHQYKIIRGYYTTLSLIIFKLVISPIQLLLLRLKESAKNSKTQCSHITEATNQIENNLTAQSSAVQETTSTLAEFTAMLSTSSAEVEKTSKQSANNSKEAKEGIQTAQNAVHTIQDLSENNNKIENTLGQNNQNLEEIVNVINRISEKTQMINDIVFQTKLLSFNASVEAARSGEHGKGFAVVAEEVGNLAQMSGSAAEEISGIINEGVSKIQDIMRTTKAVAEELIKTGNIKIENGTAVIKKCENVLQELSLTSDKTLSSMESINIAYKEQSTGVYNISEAMNHINDAITENLNSAAETSNKSKLLFENATTIDEIVEEMSSLILGKK